VERLRSIPGIGLLSSTALVGFVGDVRRFPSGRHFASYLGLTPREYSSGSRRRLGRISKLGDAYLRTLLIHGARAVLVAARRRSKTDRFRAWALAITKLLSPWPTSWHASFGPSGGLASLSDPRVLSET